MGLTQPRSPRDLRTPPGGSETIATLGYPATSNRVTQVTQNATTVRSIGYDAAGNITSDSRLGSVYAYTYNKANRLKTVSYEGNLKGTYTYNGLHQLIKRVVTNSGSLDGTTHYVHDRSGNVIAELNAAGATVREYIWLPEAEIAPTAASRAQIDRPITVVDGVDTATPATYYVHTDHLHRPIRMSNAAKSFVWSAEYQPWGAVQSLSGALTLDLRFPGQWFQLEAGLHYNWHRHYDATLGRYTQPDPLGFVDGPSVHGYAGASPLRWLDPRGLDATRPPPSNIPGGPWTYYPNSQNSRGGEWRDGAGNHTSWDPDGHWDLDPPGGGPRQRFDQWGNPITTDQAHDPNRPGSSGPLSVDALKRWKLFRCPAPIIILPPNTCTIVPELPGCNLSVY